MGITAFPFSAVLDVGANTLLGNNTGVAAAASALSASQVRSLCSLYSSTEVDTLLGGKSNVGHTHSQSDVTGLTTALAGKSNVGHTHPQSDITGLTAALAAKADLVGGLVPASQLPSYVDDVIESANLAAFPATGEAGKIYVALDTGRTYRWGGSSYVELTDSTAVWGSISGTLANQTDLQTALNGKSSVGHTQAWNTITSTPTTLAGYGITDGVTATAVAAGYQPLDADLTAIAALTGTGIYYRSAADTWSLVTIGSGLTFTGGTLAASGGSGIGGSTGATDNAVLRADGTSGTTLQTSGVTISDTGETYIPQGGLITVDTPGQYETGTRFRVVLGGVYTGQNIAVFRIQGDGTCTSGLSYNSGGFVGLLTTTTLTLDGGWGSISRAAGNSFNETNTNRFTNTYGLHIVCGANNGVHIANGANAQSLSVYNTHTSGTSLERVKIGWSANVCTIATEKGSAGGADRSLRVQGFEIPVNYTASPNNTVNHLSMQATGATANVSVSIVPKGTGSFSLAVPDGTTTGGNVRGANAIDLQTSRTNANQVASGANSVAIGINNRASADGSVTIGSGSTVTAIVNSVAIGASSATGGGGGRCVAIGNATASAEYSIAIGNCTASGAGAIAIAHEGGAASAGGSIAIGPGGPSASGICSMVLGGGGAASRTNELTFGFRHSQFDVRPGGFFLSATTTNATATALQARNIFGSSNFTTRANTVLHGTLHVTGIKSDGSAVAVYTRRIILKNVGGTITLVENQTIGTDYEDNANTNLTISNASPFFEVTGVASETWRWSGYFTPTCEMAYGT